MLSSFVLAALCVLALLMVTSVRRIPEGQVYTFRRMDGHLRIVGSGTHLVAPLIERVAHKISLTGATAAIDDLAQAGQRYRATVYFQVLDPQRANRVIHGIEDILRAATRRLFDDAALPGEADARRAWLKQHLNAELRDSGLLIARVDLLRADTGMADMAAAA